MSFVTGLPHLEQGFVQDISHQREREGQGCKYSRSPDQHDSERQFAPCLAAQGSTCDRTSVLAPESSNTLHELRAERMSDLDSSSSHTTAMSALGLQLRMGLATMGGGAFEVSAGHHLPHRHSPTAAKLLRSAAGTICCSSHPLQPAASRMALLQQP